MCPAEGALKEATYAGGTRYFELCNIGRTATGIINSRGFANHSSHTVDHCEPAEDSKALLIS